MTTALRPCSALLLAIFAWSGTAAPAYAQDPVEFGRLSSDQRQLAEQVRRLDKILQVLEEHERKEGQQSRAELLQQARLRLANVNDDRPLSSVLEAVAADLNELRAGSALSQQAELVRFLEELLDFLLETERREQVQDRLQAALQREQALRALAKEQDDLRQRTEDLEKQERECGQTDPGMRAQLAKEQAELNQKIRDLAEEQKNTSAADNAAEAAKEGEQAEQQIRPDEQVDSEEQNETGEPKDSNEAGETGEPQDPNETGEPQDPGEQGEPAAQENSEQQSDPQAGKEAGESKPSQSKPGQSQSPPPTPEQLNKAQEHQQRAQEILDEAADQAKKEAEQLKNMDELETLINVLEKAEELAARHDRVERQLFALVDDLQGESRVPRSSRVKLRQWSNEEKVLSEETNALMFEIREAGADSYPFLMRLLLEDHAALAKALGPPKYKANLRAVALSERITKDWQHLIEAIRIEMERLRRKIEQPPGGGESEPEEDQGTEPLVGMAAEVQLLKMLQGDLRDEIVLLQRRQMQMQAAGIEMDFDDMAELDNLVQRQQQLRSLFESILERMREQEGEAGGEEI